VEAPVDVTAGALNVTLDRGVRAGLGPDPLEHVSAVGRQRAQLIAQNDDHPGGDGPGTGQELGGRQPAVGAVAERSGAPRCTGKRGSRDRGYDDRQHGDPDGDDPTKSAPHVPAS
jgi:hypothetical protein